MITTSKDVETTTKLDWLCFIAEPIRFLYPLVDYE
jgi:hypothetical protein